MINSITAINTWLVDIKTVKTSLLIKLQQAGFNTQTAIGPEEEYSIKSLISGIDTLTNQMLTISASREQFVQRTSFSERKKIESFLQKLFICLKQTCNTLELLKNREYQIQKALPLCYKSEQDGISQLPLVNAIEYLDQLKPYLRILELIITQERIHALSAVLETMLQKQPPPSYENMAVDSELTEDQQNALELSHYLVKQAL
ncbi:MAG: hypothetical protein OQL09_09050 [Gammaproteobacteria bacterium]|nr:hypothetical protein [Gammaproteobacteria bacterium]